MSHLRHLIHVIVMIACVVGLVVLFDNIPTLHRMMKRQPVETIISCLIGVAVFSHFTADAIIRLIAKKTQQRRTAVSNLPGESTDSPSD
jgi:hypothetical protein